jgi:hypothetical protein
MSDPEVRSQNDSGDLRENLSDLDSRIARIESHLGLSLPTPVPVSEHVEPSAGPTSERDVPVRDSLEQRVGEFGFAWLGSLTVLLGVIFGVSYAYGLGYRVLALGIGYATAMAFYVVSRSWRESDPLKARLMINSSGLLLFYTTVRLHFLADSPLLRSQFLAIVAAPMATIALILSLLTALLADGTHSGLPIVVACSVVGVFLAMKRDWWGVLITTVLASYLTMLIWQIGNPLMGHALAPEGQSPASLVYVLLCASVYSWPTLFFDEYTSVEPSSLAVILFNILGASLLVSLTAIIHYSSAYAGIYAVLAVVLVGLSAVQRLRTHTQAPPALYAGFGFLSLSIAIYGFLGIPSAYFWLAVQSLLVVSMALWYRSRLLVVANSFIYAAILLAYLATSPQTHTVNFSFALVALGSARIMNWQKERLTLQTEMLRNAYLLFALIFVAYSLFNAVPREYVTISWAVAAAGYIGISLLFNNWKYRWMGLLTLLWTVLYLFLVDLARLAPGYRVLAFLGLGLVAVLISVFYTRFKKFLTRE